MDRISVPVEIPNDPLCKEAVARLIDFFNRHHGKPPSSGNSILDLRWDEGELTGIEETNKFRRVRPKQGKRLSR